ncbi:MAG TPA: hypothetical protein VKF84_13170 [Candidatus Sulfotelmatobacter sp.]|nr:hypothetical protein [Candidatus Sulfotelmatobacter sp.]
MRKASVLLLLLVVASLILSCGSGSGRHLQSITLTQTAINNGKDDQFIATGTFSAPPTTVTPLPVDWTNGLMAPPPPTYSYTLTTQPYVVNCTTVGPEAPTVVAFAPPDPNAPTSGTSKIVVTAAAMPACLPGGQFVQ